MIGLSIITGTLAAFLWSVGDLFAKRTIPVWKGSLPWVLWGQLAGTLFYLGMFCFGDLAVPSVSPQGVLVLAVLGLVGLGGYLCFFSAIEKGKLAIVCPVASAWAGVTFILTVLFFPGSLPANAWLFLMLVLAGVVLVSMPDLAPTTRRHGSSRLSIVLALGAVLCWGIFNFSVKLTAIAAGPYLPIFAVKAWGALFAIVLWRRKTLPIPKLSRHLTVIGGLLALPAAAILDIGAYAAYVHGATHGSVPVVAAFGSLFSLFAALFGVAFMKERLTRLQWGGIGLIVVGSFFLMMG